MKKRLLSLITAFGLLFVMNITAPVYADCGSTKTQLVACDSGTQTGVSAISDLIKITVTILSVLIGVVAVGGLAYAAILYASAQDNQEQLNNARTIIRNIILGLVLYVFTVVIVNWLIPGGIIAGSPPAASPSASPSSSSSAASVQ